MKGDVVKTADFYQRSSQAWGIYGDTSKCAEFLNKAAKEVRPINSLLLTSKASSFIVLP